MYEISKYFELKKCLDWIVLNNFKKVALQFPDFYLKNSFEIAQYIEKNSKAKVYILGDTSYGSCCVDEITAEHAQCDSIIHFGDACLSAPVERIPVLFIFCQCSLDLSSFEQELLKEYCNKKKDKQYALLFDSAFSNDFDNIQTIINKVIPSSEIFHLAYQNKSNLTENKQFEKIVLGRIVSQSIDSWEDANLIFVGLPTSPLLSIWLMTFPQFTNVLHYYPNEKIINNIKSSASRMLRKRLFLIEKLKDAQNVSLVIGTLGVKGFKEAIERIRKLCKTVNKRIYVFSVGKINDAKLANFADNVDVFIFLCCPFGVILNTNDFHKPILSFFEAEIALNPSKKWFSGNGWTSEFSDFLIDKIGDRRDDEVDVSLITGKIRLTEIQESNEDNNNTKQIMQYSTENYFANRTWKGLNDEHLETDADTICKPGLEGIAVGYVSEKN